MIESTSASDKFNHFFASARALFITSKITSLQIEAIGMIQDALVNVPDNVSTVPIQFILDSL